MLVKAMIKDVRLVRAMEAEFISREKLTYRQSLRLFEAMWEEGVHLGVLPPSDPMEGLEVDLRIARILNSCSRTSSPD